MLVLKLNNNENILKLGYSRSRLLRSVKTGWTDQLCRLRREFVWAQKTIIRLGPHLPREGALWENAPTHCSGKSIKKIRLHMRTKVPIDKEMCGGAMRAVATITVATCDHRRQWSERYTCGWYIGADSAVSDPLVSVTRELPCYRRRAVTAEHRYVAGPLHPVRRAVVARQRQIRTAHHCK